MRRDIHKQVDVKTVIANQYQLRCITEIIIALKSGATVCLADLDPWKAFQGLFNTQKHPHLRIPRESICCVLKDEL